MSLFLTATAGLSLLALTSIAAATEQPGAVAIASPADSAVSLADDSAVSLADDSAVSLADDSAVSLADDSAVSPAGSASERAVQDYADREQNVSPPDEASGREDHSAIEPEDYYLFLPRTLLYLPNLLLEGAFYPLRKTADLVGEYQIAPRVKALLYNDAETAVIHPTTAYQSGYGLSFGVRAAHRDLFGYDEQASLEARYGGLYQQAYKFSFEGKRVGGSPLWLSFDGRYEVKPGLRFFGYGARDLDETNTANTQFLRAPRDISVATRHLERHGSISATIGASNGRPGSLSRFGLNALYHRRTFEQQRGGFEEPSIERIYDTSKIVGFDQGIEVLELSPLFVWDSRSTPVLTTEGAYFEAFGGHTMPITDDADFWHYGATGSIFFALYGKSRVLALRGMVEAVHGRDQDIPFSELIKIGGGDRLRGYLRDRYRDKIAAVGSIEYRYPIHEFVAGEAFLDAGQVGRTYADIFGESGLSSLRYGGGFGLVFHSQDKTYFKAEAAYGEGFVVFVATDPLAIFNRRHKRL